MHPTGVMKSISVVLTSMVLVAGSAGAGGPSLALAAEHASQSSVPALDTRAKHQQAAQDLAAETAAGRGRNAGQPDRAPGAGTGPASAPRSSPSSQAGASSERAAEQHGPQTQLIPNQLIVVFKDDAAVQTDTVAAGVGQVVKEHPTGKSRLLQVRDVAAAKNALAA